MVGVGECCAQEIILYLDSHLSSPFQTISHRQSTKSFKLSLRVFVNVVVHSLFVVLRMPTF